MPVNELELKKKCRTFVFQILINEMLSQHESIYDSKNIKQ